MSLTWKDIKVMILYRIRVEKRVNRCQIGKRTDHKNLIPQICYFFDNLNEKYIYSHHTPLRNFTIDIRAGI